MMINNDRNRFTLRIPTGTMARIKTEAARRGVTANALIASIIWEHVEKNKEGSNDDKRITAI